MTYLDAVLLGIVQGVTEFLPISSSGHLVLLEHLLELGPHHASEDHAGSESVSTMALNVALHFGSLLAILVVFRRELPDVLRNRRLLLAMVIATLPLVPVGLFLDDLFEQTLNTPLAAGCGLCFTAGLLFLSRWLDLRRDPLDRPSLPTEAPAVAEGTSLAGAGHPSVASAMPSNAARDLSQIGWRDALIVGLFQMVAPTPGVSRSGSTIVGGLVSGLKRDAAARFAFLIAIPAILGAVVLKAKDLLKSSGTPDAGPILVGTLVSFVLGVLCLSWLLRLISQRRLHWFGWYCLALGGTVLIWSLRP